MPEFLDTFVDSLASQEQKDFLKNNREIVFTYVFENGERFKIHIFFQQGFLSVTLRSIPPAPPPLNELNVPAQVEVALSGKKGLVLIAGAVGSGRTTVLASLVHTINTQRAEHIVTIEQPVEFLLSDAKSIVDQREVGRDTPSVEQALLGLQNEDVTVVVVSDIISPETLKLMMRLAVSGRLVLGCVVGDPAYAVLETLLYSFPSAEESQARTMLSETLLLLMVRRLVPKIGGGLVALHELMTNTQPVRSTIESGSLKHVENIVRSASGKEMFSFDQALTSARRKGWIA